MSVYRRYSMTTCGVILIGNEIFSLILSRMLFNDTIAGFHFFSACALPFFISFLGLPWENRIKSDALRMTLFWPYLESI